MSTPNAQRGFTILFAVLIASILLAIGIAIFDITVRELRLSSVARESQFAIYAAETGVECALYWDSKYSGSSSAFPGGEEGTGSTQTIFLTSGSEWIVPSDWDDDDNTIEVIGGGGGGGGGSYAGLYTRGAGGGGGGGYSRAANLDLTPGATMTYGIGAGGYGGSDGGGSNGDNGGAGGGSFFGGSSYATALVRAAGGNPGLCAYCGPNGLGGSGGAASSGIGTVKYSGGTGGTSYNTGSNQGGGGGGAAGPGGNGGTGTDGTAAGGVGGAGGGGGGGAGGGISTSGGSGSEWDSSHGSGGGGGGGQGALGGAGGLYGAGGGGGGANGGAALSWSGGAGRQGIIAIRYAAAPVTTPTSGVMCDSHDIAANGTPPAPYDANPATWGAWSISTAGATTTTQFTMPVASGNACSIVSVAKSINASGQARTIVDSRGYNVGCGSLTDANATERALRVTF